LWGDFWNAVSSVVENPLGAVLSLATVVWNGAVAIATYVNHLAHEAAGIGAQVLARVASTLVSIGKVILNALQELLQYIIEIASAALRAAFEPIVAAAEAYTGRLASDFQQTVNDSLANRSLAADESRFWSDVAQPLFWVALAAAVVIEVVVTTVEGVTLGTGFILSLIIGALISETLAASVLAGGQNVATDFAKMSPLSPSVAYELGNLTESSGSSMDGLAPEGLTAGPLGGIDTTDFDVLGSILGAGTTSVAGSVVLTAWEQKTNAPWSDTVGAALGIIGMVVGAAGAAANSLFGSILSMVFDADSVIIDVFGPEDGLPALVNALVILGDVGALATDVVEVVEGG
ncbi:MAG: hypothetical protein WA719_07835, partial [Thermoplasmata archaeon]